MFLDIAGALADVGDADAARQALSSTLGDLQGTPDDSSDDWSKIVPAIRAAQILDGLGDTVGPDPLSSFGEEWVNRAYALSDHAVAVAETGDIDGALAALEAVSAGPIRASGLSRIAVSLARHDPTDKAEALAAKALQLIARTAHAAHGGAAETGAAPQGEPQVRPLRTTSLQFVPGDEVLKEGACLLSRALSSLPALVDETPLPDAVISAVAASSAGRSGWVRTLKLDDILRRILTHQTEHGDRRPPRPASNGGILDRRPVPSRPGLAVGR